MIRRTDRELTPVYDSVRAAAVEGIPFATGYPPRHPDIYRQLCTEIGHDPRCSAYTDIAGDSAVLLPGHRALREISVVAISGPALTPFPGGRASCRSPRAPTHIDRRQLS
jgi:hypothetical protein